MLTRREMFMGLGAGALLVGGASAQTKPQDAPKPAQNPDERREDGGVWQKPNLNPRTLKASDVDVAMWPIVSKINRSNWVWTTESCQGHADTGQTPLLGLVTNDIGRLFQRLTEAEAAVAVDASDERYDPRGLRLVVTGWHKSQLPALGRHQVRLVVLQAGQTDLALKVFGAFADHV